MEDQIVNIKNLQHYGCIKEILNKIIENNLDILVEFDSSKDIWGIHKNIKEFTHDDFNQLESLSTRIPKKFGDALEFEHLPITIPKKFRDVFEPVNISKGVSESIKHLIINKADAKKLLKSKYINVSSFAGFYKKIGIDSLEKIVTVDSLPIYASLNNTDQLSFLNNIIFSYGINEDPEKENVEFVIYDKGVKWTPPFHGFIDLISSSEVDINQVHLLKEDLLKIGFNCYSNSDYQIKKRHRVSTNLIQLSVAGEELKIKENDADNVDFPTGLAKRLQHDYGISGAKSAQVAARCLKYPERFKNLLKVFDQHWMAFSGGDKTHYVNNAAIEQQFTDDEIIPLDDIRFAPNLIRPENATRTQKNK